VGYFWRYQVKGGLEKQITQQEKQSEEERRRKKKRKSSRKSMIEQMNDLKIVTSEIRLCCRENGSPRTALRFSSWRSSFRCCTAL
jgi:hypothetical protein